VVNQNNRKMERTRSYKKATAILCSDFHLREDTPVCRTDNFWETQWQKMEIINELQRRHDCFVLHAGDLFHHWKPSPYLLSTTMEHLPAKFYTVLGQHDLPQHSLKLIEKCGVYTLEKAGKLKLLNGTHWDQEPMEAVDDALPKGILVWHHLTYITPPFPGATGGQALGLLKKYSQFRLIVTGDNHQSFYQYVDEKQSRVLVNPGSLTRQTADQIDFQPRVALWYEKENDIVWVNISVRKDAVTREHLEKTEQRNARIEAFVNRLNDDWRATMSFEDNLGLFFKTNNVRESVKEIIYKSIEK